MLGPVALPIMSSVSDTDSKFLQGLRNIIIDYNQLPRNY